jgi:hypothetical protein
MTTTVPQSGITTRTPANADKPWIHVRAKLLERIWMGLAFFSVDGPLTAWAGQQECSPADAAGG